MDSVDSKISHVHECMRCYNEAVSIRCQLIAMSRSWSSNGEFYTKLISLCDELVEAEADKLPDKLRG